MKKRASFLIIISCLSLNCFNQQINSDDTYIPFTNVSDEYRDEANQILGEILDNEGLYTFLADIKPMSSVQLKNGFSIYKKTIHVRNDSNNIIAPTEIKIEPNSSEQAEYYLNKIRDTVDFYSKVLLEMSDDIFHFQFAPIINFNWTLSNPVKHAKMPNVIILRKDLVLDKIKKKATFFNSINIDTSSNYFEQLNSILLNVNHMELEADFKWNYYPAMAYLAGVPENSIDFNMEQTHEVDSIITIVDNKNDTVKLPIYKKRPEIYKIPVYQPEKSFKYGIPINKKISDDDINLRTESEIILENYKKLRAKYSTSQGIDAISLIQDYFDK